VSIRRRVIITSRQGKCSRRVFARFRRRAVYPRKIAAVVGRSTTSVIIADALPVLQIINYGRDKISITVGSYDNAVRNHWLYSNTSEFLKRILKLIVFSVQRSSQIVSSQIDRSEHKIPFKRKSSEAGVSAERYVKANRSRSRDKVATETLTTTAAAGMGAMTMMTIRRGSS